jgi:serine/threonine-protein kinase HipA
MRKVAVYRNQIYAGELTEEGKSYLFRYDDAYYADASKPAISLTFPKSQQEYRSPFLFPFFFNMLSEGVNRKWQQRVLRLDEHDDFGLLAETAQNDTIGAITIKPIVT